MNHLNMSLERVREWIFTTADKENGFYPPKPRSEAESYTDELIIARFCLMNKALMGAPHESIMKEQGFAEKCGKLADLPVELVTVYLIYLRSMFTKGRGIKMEWMDRLYEFHVPIKKWDYIVMLAGIRAASKTDKIHDESLLGNYFVESLKNRREYRDYTDAQNALIKAGKSVHILNSVEYFKRKGSHRKSESDESGGGLLPAVKKARKIIEMDR
jgi:hypothetical protein